MTSIMNFNSKNQGFRITFISILFIMISTLSMAQNNEATLNHLDQIAKKMFVDMNNRDFDAILDMTHPKVYDIIPKEQMKNMLKMMFEGTEEFSIDIPKVIPEYKVSNIFKGNQNNLEYAFISYDMKMKMTFKNQEFDDDAKDMMKGIMQSKGMDVKFISNNTLDIMMNNRMTIILKEDATSNKWVMLNYDPDSPIFYKALSSDLLEAAKTYNQNLMLESKKKTENNNSK